MASTSCSGSKAPSRRPHCANPLCSVGNCLHMGVALDASGVSKPEWLPDRNMDPHALLARGICSCEPGALRRRKRVAWSALKAQPLEVSRTRKIERFISERVHLYCAIFCSVFRVFFWKMTKFQL